MPYAKCRRERFDMHLTATVVIVTLVAASVAIENPHPIPVG